MSDHPAARVRAAQPGGAQATLVAVLALGYLYLLPLAAEVVARSLPISVEQRIGDGALDFLDDHILLPTQLPAARRTAITTRFRALTAEVEGVPHYEIVFRKSRIGPNALALPSGQIVLTDEIVTLLDDDDAVMGVLAHELGHVHRRHLMRRLIQSSAIGDGLVRRCLGGDRQYPHRAAGHEIFTRRRT